LSGNRTIAEILNGNGIFISFITQLDNKLSQNEINKIQSFIDDCIIIDLNEDIKEKVIKLRRKYKNKNKTFYFFTK
jgi:tRNA(Ser,Leu) C12 N-acetylase TAN1